MTNGVYIVVLNETATTEIYTLSLHDALPISSLFNVGYTSAVFGAVSGLSGIACFLLASVPIGPAQISLSSTSTDRKSTRLNFSHANISYAVFCLKKKHI